MLGKSWEELLADRLVARGFPLKIDPRMREKWTARAYAAFVAHEQRKGNPEEGSPPAEAAAAAAGPASPRRSKRNSKRKRTPGTQRGRDVSRAEERRKKSRKMKKAEGFKQASKAFTATKMVIKKRMLAAGGGAAAAVGAYGDARRDPAAAADAGELDEDGGS